MVQPRDSKRARLLLPSATLGALDNDLLIRCASYLDADGLAQLGRTSAGLGIPQAGRQRSLVNEAAHQRFRQSATDEERNRLPKYGDESDIGLYRALLLLREPLGFDEIVGDDLSAQEHPAKVTCAGVDLFSTAMSGHVMRGGRHFVEFAINDMRNGLGDEIRISLGVIRPVSLTGWEGAVNPMFVSSFYRSDRSAGLQSQRTAKWGDSNIHCCTYFCCGGSCVWTDWNNERGCPEWQGREGLEESGTIGLLLDLDEGTLSVFKNGRRLGVMEEGLGGEYCWFVAVSSACMISMTKGRAAN